VKLLRVLQEGEFRPVGSAETKKVDVRVIAATHRSLEQMVKESKFREDLYYRLKVISIHLPPLRERLEDLPELVSHFLSVHSEKNHKRISHVSEDAMTELKRYSWPGNIRELEHSIERAVAMSSGNVLFPEDFPEEIRQSSSVDMPLPNASGDPNRSLEDVEKEHILRVLKEVNYNKSKASDVLGIDRATLYRKAQKYGIDLAKTNS
jgi:transcriptional regulator with PAS, ATPase and Fis domain